MAGTVREPKQVRSIETKKRIIDAGYKMFAEKGYFNTNTAEIAKKAGVSTGIVYGYFRDKRDILLDVLDIYIGKVFEPIFVSMSKLSDPLDFEKLADKILDYAVSVHKQNSAMHEALHSLVSVDKAVGDRFAELERAMTENTAEVLKKCGVSIDGLTERVHLTIDMVQSFAHEVVFDDHSYIDYAAMRGFFKRMLVDLFSA